MTGHVFISYSRTDGLKQALHLEGWLEAQGFITWRDTRSISPINDFTAQLERAIEHADFVLVCLTPSSKDADSFVRREITYALLNNKRVVPVRFAPIVPHLQIVTNEWIDAFADWNGAMSRLRSILSTVKSAAAKDLRRDEFESYLRGLYDQTVHLLDALNLPLLDVPITKADRNMSNSYSRVLESVSQRSKQSKRTFANLTDALMGASDRLLLVGDAGSGKTTTLLALTRDAITTRFLNPSAKLPVLGFLSEWSPKVRLVDWLSRKLGVDADRGLDLISGGQCLILLDGVDEVRSKGRKSLSRMHLVTQLVGQLPSSTSLVLTMRPDGYNGVQAKAPSSIAAMSLVPLTRDQVTQALEQRPDLKRMVHRSSMLADLTANPLMLSLLGSVSETEAVEVMETSLIRVQRRLFNGASRTS